jgi:hypothetical protein
MAFKREIDNNNCWAQIPKLPFAAERTKAISLLIYSLTKGRPAFAAAATAISTRNCHFSHSAVLTPFCREEALPPWLRRPKTRRDVTRAKSRVNVAFLCGCVLARSHLCAVAFLRGCVFARLRFCAVAFLHGCVFVRLRFCAVAFLRGCVFLCTYKYILCI